MGGTILSSPVTVVTVLAFMVTLIATGILMPRPIVKMLLKSKDEEIAMWKQIAKDRGEGINTALGYAQDSLDVMRPNVKALEALVQAAGQGDPDASAKVS